MNAKGDLSYRTDQQIKKRPSNPELNGHPNSAGSTNRLGTRLRSAWNTTGASPKNSVRRPRNSANAGTAASPRSQAKRAVPRALRPTGSPAGAATPGGGHRPRRCPPRKNRPRRHRCDSAQNPRSGIRSQSLRSMICVGRVKEIPVKIANSQSTTNTEAFMSSEPDSDVGSRGQRVIRGDGAFRGSSPPRWA